jgi:hypothetical protein
MAKIVAVHIGTTQNSFSLLQRIEEAGFLDKVKQAVGLGKQPPQQPPQQYQQPEPEPERATPSLASGVNSALATLAGELMTPAPSETRLVVFLPHAWLKSLYLIPGGGGKLIDELDDAEITDIATSTPVSDTKDGKARIVELKPGFSFKSMLTPPSTIGSADRAVLINAPKKLVAELRAAGTDVSKAREVLKKLMSHKIYVMTLNLSKANNFKLITKMNAARNADEMAKVFNPAIIENYPIHSVLVQAIGEWESLMNNEDKKREAEVAQKEKEADLARRKRDAEAMMADPSSDEDSELINLITRAESSFKAAEKLKKWAVDNKIAKTDLFNMLNALEKKYPLINVTSVADKLKKLM